MNKPTLRTLEVEAPKKKSNLPLVLGIILFGAALAWGVDHIVGDCLDVSRALEFCPVR